MNQWITYAIRAMLIDRSVYSQIDLDEYMTAPALMIALIGITTQTITSPAGFILPNFITRLIAWIIAIGLLYLATQFLRGKASFPAYLRVAGFSMAA